MYIIILCGGSGTRLWPLSRKNFPKQFLNLAGDISLLQSTYERAKKITAPERIFCVTNQDNYYNSLNQLKEITKNFNPENILIEPAAKNTAPAMLLAAKYLIEKKNINQPDPMIFMPADHHIPESYEYFQSLARLAAVSKKRLSTIGINPTTPHTGYGYIRKGDEIASKICSVLEFKEKPDAQTAQDYLISGQFLWNSGIYAFSPESLAHELSNENGVFKNAFTHNYNEFLDNFSNLPALPFDIVFAEKSNNMAVVEGDFAWSDIGSFDALLAVSENKYKKQIISVASENVSAITKNSKVVSFIGVNDLIVIENNDSILVCKKGQSELVKEAVKKMEATEIGELYDNLLVHRPWGKYEVLIDTTDHKVKKITVYPGAKLSLQSHYHRSEHWVIIKGSAKVTNEDKTLILTENQSTFIPQNTIHRLENPGKINLEIIEVQTGRYLEEDDIQRFDDVYKR